MGIVSCSYIGCKNAIYLLFFHLGPTRVACEIPQYASFPLRDYRNPHLQGLML